MKRILSVLLLVSVFLSLFGCNGETAETAENKATAETKENPEPNPPEDFEYKELDDGTIKVWYIGKDQERVVFPETIDGKTVTATYTMLPVENNTVCSVHLPNTITEIGPATFEKWTALEEIHLPSSLTQIGMRAFMECTSLKSIEIKSSCLTKMSEECFVNSGLETVILSDEITYIPNTCFAQTKIRQIVMPKSLKEIGYGAMGGCTELETIVLNEGLLTIGDNAFIGNLKLKEIMIPESVKSISELAFVQCANLEKVKFEGDAPDYQIDDAVLKAIYEDDLSEKTANYTVCYREGAVGFTSPEWCGHPTEIW